MLIGDRFRGFTTKHANGPKVGERGDAQVVCRGLRGWARRQEMLPREHAGCTETWRRGAVPWCGALQAVNPPRIQCIIAGRAKRASKKVFFGSGSREAFVDALRVAGRNAHAFRYVGDSNFTLFRRPLRRSPGRNVIVNKLRIDYS